MTLRRPTAIQPDHTDRVLSTEEVIARSTLSRSTLYRLSRAGQIPRPIRITPGRIGWPESQVSAWLSGRQPAA